MECGSLAWTKRRVRCQQRSRMYRPCRTAGRRGRRLMTAFFEQWMPYEWAWFTATISGILLIALLLMLAVAMIIYVDRKVWAAMALRRGPNVVGPWGLLQRFADGPKETGRAWGRAGGGRDV